jgi:TRAP-type mannitol/chloroaromatic compound transport system permease small subunit
MGLLLGLARGIDAINEYIGRWVSWLALAAVLVSAANALSRYTFSASSNAWLELQWYMFSAMFLLAAGYTLKHNDHVRLDVLFARWSPRTQAWVDIFGTLFFLLPVCCVILYYAWPFFMTSWGQNEQSADPGGLVRYPIKFLVPLGFALIILQAIAELVKRFAFLSGRGPDPLLRKERVR